MKKPMPTAGEVRSFLQYDPDSGAFARTAPRGSIQPGPLSPTPNSNGYLRVVIHKQSYYLHRLAWLWMTGTWPQQQIDHINGDRADNRWCNLREATHAENCLNTKLRSNNTSGTKGVSWHKLARKWKAEIHMNGVSRHIGVFADKGTATAAVIAARAELHGLFANQPGSPPTMDARAKAECYAPPVPIE